MGKRDPPRAKPPDRVFDNPFEKLAGRREGLPPGPAPAAPPTPGPHAPEPPGGPARAVVRYERKGHGGKEVTVVEQLGLPARELERWLKEAKTSLGCGGRIEDGALVLQGDQRERLRRFLEARGVRRISVG